MPCSLKAFFVKGGPVGNTSEEKADVNIIKMVWRVDPFAAAVVNLKAEIFRRRYLLEGWGEIGS